MKNRLAIKKKERPASFMSDTCLKTSRSASSVWIFPKNRLGSVQDIPDVLYITETRHVSGSRRVSSCLLIGSPCTQMIGLCSHQSSHLGRLLHDAKLTWVMWLRCVTGHLPLPGNPAGGSRGSQRKKGWPRWQSFYRKHHHHHHHIFYQLSEEYVILSVFLRLGHRQYEIPLLTAVRRVNYQ